MAMGGSAVPFTKESSNYPCLCAPKTTSPAGSGRYPKLPAKGAPDPPLRHPQCPGIPAINYTPERVGALGLGLPVPVKVDDSEGRRVNTTKPQHRLKSNRAVLDKGV